MPFICELIGETKVSSLTENTCVLCFLKIKKRDTYQLISPKEKNLLSLFPRRDVERIFTRMINRGGGRGWKEERY